MPSRLAALAPSKARKQRLRRPVTSTTWPAGVPPSSSKARLRRLLWHLTNNAECERQPMGIKGQESKTRPTETRWKSM